MLINHCLSVSAVLAVIVNQTGKPSGIVCKDAETTRNIFSRCLSRKTVLTASFNIRYPENAKHQILAATLFCKPFVVPVIPVPESSAYEKKRLV